MLLSGKTITKSGADLGTGEIWDSNVEILCSAADGGADMLLTISTPIKYHMPGEKLPKSHQLLLAFEDGSHMSCTVQMWGSMLCAPYAENAERRQQGPSPLTDAFDKTYFDRLLSGVKPAISAKAFLATEKRIPGLGNGVLQDILFNAGIHPKRKLQEMGDEDRDKLFRSVKSTLYAMTAQGGRDTEKDLFGRRGGYKTILSANTLRYPCPVCGGGLVRQAYLGGNTYFCPACQPVEGA
jgi:formamidopyrimidine-DNA glycosylase